MPQARQAEQPKLARDDDNHAVDEEGRHWRLIGPDGRPFASTLPGTLGGHRRGRRYGRLDCRAARQAIARGGYVTQRVFFADEATALAAGYRPCAVCLPARYAAWKAGMTPRPDVRTEPGGVEHPMHREHAEPSQPAS